MRSRWVRCRSRTTGHEFDLLSSDPRVLNGTVIVLDRYPENLTPRPRRAKHRMSLRDIALRQITPEKEE